jgi:DNA-binding NarL/FixJ family response regulator
MLKRLLVVDDEPNLLTAIAAVLRGKGFEVTTARNGKDALLQIAKSLPDLIVSDVRMPVMDGYRLARQLRAAPHTKLIPIVFLTAKDETEDRIEGFHAGVDVYLQNILARVERTRTAITTLVGSREPEDEIFVRDEELTDAEWRVAEAIARGHSNKEIAAELDLSIRTIENHVSRILSKKNFTNRVEIARLILAKQTNK